MSLPARAQLLNIARRARECLVALLSVALWFHVTWRRRAECDTLRARLCCLSCSGCQQVGDLPRPLDQLCSTRGILPAEGIGSINLGDSFVDTVHRLGQPWKMAVTHSDDPSASDARWQSITRPEEAIDGHAFADFGSQSHLLEIRALNNALNLILIAAGTWSCQDSHGIHIGTSGSDIIDQYGQGYSMRRASKDVSVVYNSLGLHFGLTATGSGLRQVLAISVFLPNQCYSVWGHSFCSRFKPPLQ